MESCSWGEKGVPELVLKKDQVAGFGGYAGSIGKRISGPGQPPDINTI
jgi:hypothetical protein